MTEISEAEVSAAAGAADLRLLGQVDGRYLLSTTNGRTVVRDLTLAQAAYQILARADRLGR